MLLSLLPGCRPAPSPAAPPSPPAPRPGFVAVERYAAWHPASERIRSLEARLARLGAPRTSAPAPVPPEAPAADASPLPEPRPAAGRPEPSRSPDRRRARRAIREDYAVRARALPDFAGERYGRRVEELQAEAERTPAPAPPPTDDQEQESREAGERMSRLSTQIRALAERPSDSLFYTPEERRQRAAELSRQLEELRGQQVERLRRALIVPSVPPVTVPPEALRAAEAERDRERAEQRRALAEKQRGEIGDLENLQLPSPPPRPEPPAARAEAVEPPPVPGRASPAAGASGGSGTGATAARRRALAALGRELEGLRQAMMADLRAAALAAGREHGVRVTFDRGRAPDRTEELLPAIRRILGATR